MGIISEGDAKAVLAPYEQELLACVEEAWKVWKGKAASLVSRPRSRWRAGIVSGLIEEQVRMRFGAMKSVHLIDKGERLLVGVESKLLLRFKKVNEKLQTSNYPTRTSRRFDNQQPLEGYADLPRLTVGYRANRLATELLEVVLVFSIGSAVKFSWPLVGAARPQQMTLPTQTANTQKTGKKRRVTAKKTQGPGQKDGSEGEQV
ncbi:hypothetical protein SAMN05444354_118160 [Stigmatella aurantiaca]|uniref:Uncharacterized protein n=1 Tax=Stigmatella aurantiaca TaxID=41 RepID=A0A1H7ZC54_STIAU|nr:hypothetical protein [Stigmatella aurantiaca]SEM55990.1 hypothetical protein SAMN05444354_118160 [Stigmatella aurantiaca]